MLENDLSRNITYKLFQFTSTNLVSYRPQNLPLRMSCWPVVAASQSASLAMLILCSSILCQLLLLPAMALPSPTKFLLCARYAEIDSLRTGSQSHYVVHRVANVVYFQRNS